MFYGDLQVVVLNETKCPEWTVTEFRISEVIIDDTVSSFYMLTKNSYYLFNLVCSSSVQGEHARNIKHFHYTVWPDFGTPEKPQSLIKFVRLVRGKLHPEAGPSVVHCRLLYG